MTALLILLGLGTLLGLYVILAYNGLVRRVNLVEEGWSGIETQLKRRADLVPNLVATVKGYAGHERNTLEEVTRMRGRALEAGSPAERAQAEMGLTAALGRLFALAEAYPDLKANKNFLELQESLDEIEEALNKARRYYNGTVRNLNIMIESFPSNLVAQAFRFRQAEFFDLDDPADRAVPKVSFG